MRESCFDAGSASDAFVLHSLPLLDELTADETRFGRCWIEAFNGVVIRMSLLTLLLTSAMTAAGYTCVRLETLDQTVHVASARGTLDRGRRGHRPEGPR